MPRITALIHTHNDEQRIGRVLDSLRAIDDVLVVDHGSTDGTLKIARHHGVRVKEGVPGVNPGVYTIDAHHDWVLCLLPNEAIGEALEASLFEWKEHVEEPLDQAEKDERAGCNETYAINIREETENGWRNVAAETRLVNRKQMNWVDVLPPNDAASKELSGELLRFSKP